MDAGDVTGIDPAENAFRLHGARAGGSVAFGRALRRGKVLEALASQRALWWRWRPARVRDRGQAIAGRGHAVRPVLPIDEERFVKRQKSDAAAAVCEVRPCALLR